MYYEEHSWQWSSHSYEIDTLSSPEGMQHKKNNFQINKSRAYISVSFGRFILWRIPITVVFSLSLDLTLLPVPEGMQHRQEIFQINKSDLTYQWALKGSCHEEPSSQWCSHCLWNWPSLRPLRYAAQTKYSADQNHSAPVMPDRSC